MKLDSTKHLKAYIQSITTLAEARAPLAVPMIPFIVTSIIHLADDNSMIARPYLDRLARQLRFEYKGFPFKMRWSHDEDGVVLQPNAFVSPILLVLLPEENQTLTRIRMKQALDNFILGQQALLPVALAVNE